MPIKKPVAEVVKELGLPEGTEFVGYVIRNPAKGDEYLHDYKISKSGMIGMLWSQHPDTAKVFKKREKAKKTIKALEKEELILGWLFDLGDRWFVTSLTSDDL
jgi:hypothetical protein